MELQFVDNDSLNFDDSSYRWVERLHYAFELADADESALLGALIRNPRYLHVDNPGEFDPSRQQNRESHGPYRLSRITPDAFETVTAIQAQVDVREFSYLYDCAPPPEVKEQIESSVNQPLRDASSIHRLRKLEDAGHLTSFIWDEWHEYVTIHRNRGELLFILLGVD